MRGRLERMPRCLSVERQKVGRGGIGDSGRRDESGCIPSRRRAYPSDENMAVSYLKEMEGNIHLSMHTIVQYVFCKIGSQ